LYANGYFANLAMNYTYRVAAVALLTL